LDYREDCRGRLQKRITEEDYKEGLKGKEHTSVDYRKPEVQGHQVSFTHTLRRVYRKFQVFGICKPPNCSYLPAVIEDYF